ncbi:MAG: hypothetical protein JRN45_00480 [Nitrososphaerota archaeon]|nr:hypothetical protein [Nitrososphaerota archaeon]
MSRIESERTIEDEERETPWDIPGFVYAHPRALSWYWNVHVELQLLDEEVSGLAGEDFGPMVRLLLLLPSSLLISACRVPFFPLDIHLFFRKRRLHRKRKEEYEARERAELDYYRRRFGYNAIRYEDEDLK